MAPGQSLFVNCHSAEVFRQVAKIATAKDQWTQLRFLSLPTKQSWCFDFVRDSQARVSGDKPCPLPAHHCGATKGQLEILRDRSHRFRHIAHFRGQIPPSNECGDRSCHGTFAKPNTFWGTGPALHCLWGQVPPHDFAKLRKDKRGQVPPFAFFDHVF